MNIFVVDQSPVRSAQSLCDTHVVKMILESAQLLCTAHHLLGTSITEPLYKATHINHPCAKWVRETSANYRWLYDHFCELMNEYTLRYKKSHACERFRNVLNVLPMSIPIAPATAFAVAMPDTIQGSNPIERYQRYYATKAYTMKRPMRYTNRVPPTFLNLP